jgi:hypothetical protein
MKAIYFFRKSLMAKYKAAEMEAKLNTIVKTGNFRESHWSR